MDYRERRLAKLFQNPGGPASEVFKIGSQGPGCYNVRRALEICGFPLPLTDQYDSQASSLIRQLQEREGHANVDGLTGPGTRALLVKILMRKGGIRVFSHFDYTGGELFPRVFVSYAREDRRVVEEVVKALKSQGVTVWVDYEDLDPGEKWDQAIAHAIPTSRYFLAMLSKYTLTKKGHVQKEVKAAWSVAEGYPDSSIFVIPARLEDCSVQETKFSELNYIDLFPDPTRGIERLIKFLAEKN